MPGADPATVVLFESLRPADGQVEFRKMFGQPAAFLGGNLCFGVFGKDLFVRLSESEAAEALTDPGMRPFEPMAGRAMRGYVVLSPRARKDRAEATRWIRQSMKFVGTLPAKTGARSPRAAKVGRGVP